MAAEMAAERDRTPGGVADATPEAALTPITGWGARNAAAAAIGPSGTLAAVGDRHARLRIASLSKPMLAVAVLIAAEEGILRLDDAAGPPGATVRHLLAHAGGYAFDSARMLAAPGARRIYSNEGFDELGRVLSRASGMAVADYLHAGVFEPLGMADTALEGSPAKDVWSTVDDIALFARELLRPTLLARETANDMTSVQYPTLSGVLPEVGTFRPNPWGLGVEIRGAKQPHWTGDTNSPSTFGHFGGSGTFLWVDPVADLALVALTDRDFGPWALDAWPRLSDGVLASTRHRAPER